MGCLTEVSRLALRYGDIEKRTDAPLEVETEADEEGLDSGMEF